MTLTTPCLEEITPGKFSNNSCQTLKEKGNEADFYSAYRQYNSTTKRSDVDHTELPANTPHLPFLRISIR